MASCSTKNDTKTDGGTDAEEDPYAMYTKDWDRNVTRGDDWEVKQKREMCGFKAGALAAETFGKGIPVGTDIPIDTIVVLMQENRSFDHYFSRLRQYTGNMDIAVTDANASQPDKAGTQMGMHVRAHAPRGCVYDVNHEWDGSHLQYNDGKMDGFFESNDDVSHAPMNAPPDVLEVYKGDRSLWYYDETDIPYYYELAKNFGIADHYHCSLLGPTWPNRQFLYAGTSFGLTYNTFPDTTQYEFPIRDMTIFDSLTKRHVTWNIYTDTNTPGLGVVYGPGGAFRWNEHRPPAYQMTKFFEDAKNGKLPQVVFVDPYLGHESATSNDEHPPATPQVGQKFVYDVVTALTNSPQWKKMAIFITYDEHGGFFDSIPPPNACEPDTYPLKLEPGMKTQAKFDRLGFRVPLLVVSPYTRKGYVAHTVYDHTSILRFIEARFKTPALTGRDANADIPLEFFDFQNPPWLTPPKMTEPKVDQAMLDWCKTTFPPK